MMTLRASLVPLLSLGAVLLSSLPAGLAANPAAPANRLQAVDFNRLKPGTPPPKPWQMGKPAEGMLVAAGAPGGGTGWIELRDDSPSVSSALRQQFAPLAAGRLLLRIHIADDHASTLGIYLGDGNASAPAERIVDLKTNDRGAVRLGSGGERQSTPLTLIPGSVTVMFIEWRPSADGKSLRLALGVVDPSGDGKGKILQRIETPLAPRPVTTLRITTDNAATGAHFFVRDLSVIALSGE